MGVQAVSGVAGGGETAIAGGMNWNTRVLGVGIASTIRRCATGRWRRAACGSRTRTSRRRRWRCWARPWSPTCSPTAPIRWGQRIRLDSVPFDVIGVLAAKGQSGRRPGPGRRHPRPHQGGALAPLRQQVQRHLGQSIYVKTVDGKALYRAQEDITSLLRDRHRIAAGKDDDFQVQNMASVMQAGARGSPDLHLPAGGRRRRVAAGRRASAS
ncbi:MAG: ABC transporter permease [Asticcacaulis sp.]